MRVSMLKSSWQVNHPLSLTWWSTIETRLLEMSRSYWTIPRVKISTPLATHLSSSIARVTCSQVNSAFSVQLASSSSFWWRKNHTISTFIQEQRRPPQQSLSGAILIQTQCQWLEVPLTSKDHSIWTVGSNNKMRQTINGYGQRPQRTIIIWPLDQLN